MKFSFVYSNSTLDKETMNMIKHPIRMDITIVIRKKTLNLNFTILFIKINSSNDYYLHQATMLRNSALHRIYRE
jgi:hypothetical protein